MQASKKGNIFIVSAASGTGKTTLVSRLIKHHDDIRVSVSHTTRPPRPGEEHGKHYYFVDVEKFKALIGESAFLEHAKVFDNYYGTSVEGVNILREQGYDVILEIDIQGAEQVRRVLPDACSIFILPPSFQELADRLKGRGTDSPEVIAKRLSKARNEIEQAFLFDYVIVNHDVVTAEADLLHIIKSYRLKLPSQQVFIENLLEKS
ncbi:MULTISPECIES: guanylate kinase [unclassified Neisseria]|uniref:guanylate kinase n=1 Tax=unclassified Neisseria TaxID=2623750 RepID=UPI0026670DA6|nr:MULTISPECIES: guanylate kinase [unclassified Neisseria]MDO1510240.1 guanylate kinase [Neisseria sp. MVDL19-042950]MDO1516409.1 guanylate kinase [Neisseria sp. MVDL18-041461]MDO1563557.1 guanylate kinase [Neisseria sp. MVDL20-010259]